MRETETRSETDTEAKTDTDRFSILNKNDSPSSRGYLKPSEVHPRAGQGTRFSHPTQTPGRDWEQETFSAEQWITEFTRRENGRLPLQLGFNYLPFLKEKIMEELQKRPQGRWLMGLKLVGCVVLCACQILRFVSPTWTVLYDPLLTHEHQTKANHPYKKTCRNRAKPEKNSALYYDYYMIYQDSLRKMLLAKTRWI